MRSGASIAGTCSNPGALASLSIQRSPDESRDRSAALARRWSASGEWQL
jgi:hypothetical protein